MFTQYLMSEMWLSCLLWDCESDDHAQKCYIPVSSIIEIRECICENIPMVYITMNNGKKYYIDNTTVNIVMDVILGKYNEQK